MTNYLFFTKNYLLKHKIFLQSESSSAATSYAAGPSAPVQAPAPVATGGGEECRHNLTKILCEFIFSNSGCGCQVGPAGPPGDPGLDGTPGKGGQNQKYAVLMFCVFAYQCKIRMLHRKTFYKKL